MTISGSWSIDTDTDTFPNKIPFHIQKKKKKKNRPCIHTILFRNKTLPMLTVTIIHKPFLQLATQPAL